MMETGFKLFYRNQNRTESGLQASCIKKGPSHIITETAFLFEIFLIILKTYDFNEISAWISKKTWIFF